MRRGKTLVAVCMCVLMVVGCVQMGAVPGAEVTDGTVIFSAEAASVVAREGDPLSVLEAEEAAALMAKAKLLEKIKGAYVTSTIKVGDLMFENQQAMATSDGYLARATVHIAPVARGAEPSMIRATATLALSRHELMRLADYVE